MKKAMIPIVLLVVLVLAMSSGSFAIYTQTQALRGQLYMRVFLFSGNESTTSYEFSLNGLTLAPGQSETELYRFTLTNTQSGGSVCDYDMSVNIASSGMGTAISHMSGLTFYLYNLSDESSSPVATITSGELGYTGLRFTANVSKSVEFRLTAKWSDNGDSAAQTAVASSAAQYPVDIVITSQASN